MDSVISQNGLNMLLASMQDSISASHLNQIFNRAFRIDVAEKNNMYHVIHNIIKSSSDTKQATSMIMEQLEEILRLRGNIVQEMMAEGVSTTQADLSNKQSPIFRRVG